MLISTRNDDDIAKKERWKGQEEEEKKSFFSKFFVDAAVGMYVRTYVGVACLSMVLRRNKDSFS
jgi:hypothetical protein